MRKLILILIIFLLFFNTQKGYSKEIKYISLAPCITEIIYAINAQNNLIAGETWGNKKLKGKPSVGDSYFINNEAIIKLHPDVIFALDCQKSMIDDLKYLGIKIHYFSFNNINSIFNCIKLTSKLTLRENQGNLLLNKLHMQMYKYKTKHPKKILYVVQPEPLISAGKYSFINDIINKAGQKNVLEELKSDYPRTSLEYVIKQKPDIIVVSDSKTKNYMKKFLPYRYIVLTPTQSNIINRPGPGVAQAIKIFASF